MSSKQTFQACINYIKATVESFNVGEMSLNSALKQYENCQKLIVICTDKLRDFEAILHSTEQIINVELDTKTVELSDNSRAESDICSKNIDFENNLKCLKELYNKLSTVSLEECMELMVEYRKLYLECMYVLNRFKVEINKIDSCIKV